MSKSRLHQQKRLVKQLANDIATAQPQKVEKRLIALDNFYSNHVRFSEIATKLSKLSPPLKLEDCSLEIDSWNDGTDVYIVASILETEAEVASRVAVMQRSLVGARKELETLQNKQSTAETKERAEYERLKAKFEKGKKST